MNFPIGKKMLETVVENKTVPCAACILGKGDTVFDSFIGGNRMITPKVLPLLINTQFDMASLSKVLGPTMIALKALESGELSLSDTLSKFFDAPPDKADITIKNLMTHTSGLNPSLPMWKECDKPENAVSYILSKPLDYAPGTKEAYSCMGYITLAKILEKISGQPLDILAHEQVFKPLKMNDTCYNPKGDNFAATEYIAYEDRVLSGIVHDENARFLNGVSGNAGVFSTLNDMSKFAAMLSKRGKGFLKPETFESAVKDYTPSFDESRGLGLLLHTIGKDDFSGKEFSNGSYGHTGFTGTSLIVDNDTGFYVVLLANRVHPSRDNLEFLSFRRKFHDTCMNEYKKIRETEGA